MAMLLLDCSMLHRPPLYINWANSNARLSLKTETNLSLQYEVEIGQNSCSAEIPRSVFDWLDDEVGGDGEAVFEFA